MHRWICAMVVAGALAAGLGVGAAAASTSVPVVTLVDKAEGYTITVPRSWAPIPRSEAGIRSLITQLKARKTAEADALASTYSSILASPQAVSELSTFGFQAFPWPPDPNTPILTELSVKVTHTSLTDTAANLAMLGQQYAAALRDNAGAKIDSPREVKLPAGNAEFVEGSVPAGGGLSNGVELYLLPHRSHLYALSFTIDARLMAKATIFAKIAEYFAVS